MHLDASPKILVLKLCLLWSHCKVDKLLQVLDFLFYLSKTIKNLFCVKVQKHGWTTAWVFWFFFWWIIICNMWEDYRGFLCPELFLSLYEEITEVEKQDENFFIHIFTEHCTGAYKYLRLTYFDCIL